MPQCTALTAKRAQCTADGKNFESLCTRHFNMKVRDDVVFRARYEAHEAELQRVYREAHAERVRIAEAAAAERIRIAAAAAAMRLAAEEARRAAEQAALRTEKIAKRTRHIADVPTISPTKTIDHARKAVEIWWTNNITGYDIPKAYLCACYISSRHEGFVPLLTALVKLRFQAFQNHPDAANYRDVPAAEREAVLAEITAALVTYGPLNILRSLPETDPTRAQIVRRQAMEAEAARQAAAREIERVRQAAFQQQLREAPVVFQRDPAGGIDLRAFAADTQSVHRSSVQDSTHRAVVALLARPTLEGVNVLEEVVISFGDPVRVKWWGDGPTEEARAASANAARDIAITELTNDYFNTEAFSVLYGDVVDRVWAFISGHEHHNELCTRLAQEIYEGRGMCSNGKMARLVNVLMGYDDSLMTEAPREVFQFRIAALTRQPLAAREAAARELFREFRIPEEEHDAWLEPLLDTDDESAAPPVVPAVGGAAGAAAHM